MQILSSVWMVVLYATTFTVMVVGLMGGKFAFIAGIITGILASFVLLFFQERTAFMIRRNYIKSIIRIYDNVLNILWSNETAIPVKLDNLTKSDYLREITSYRNVCKEKLHYSYGNLHIMLAYLVELEEIINDDKLVEHKVSIKKIAEANNFFIKALIDYADFIVDHHEFGSRFKAFFYAHPVTYQDDLLVFFGWEEKLEKHDIKFEDEPRGQAAYRDVNKETYLKNRNDYKPKNVKLTVVDKK